MFIARQTKPVLRRGHDNSYGHAAAAVTASNWQCWTEPGCSGLAYAYGNTLGDCCVNHLARSGRGINEDQGQGCVDCP
jgi:hypothetical protein